MATLTPTEQKRLGLVRPETMALLLAMMDAAELQLGYRTMVPDFGGWRSSSTQQSLYADSLKQGGGVLAYPVGAPGTSRHELGAAFDLHIIAGGRGTAGVGEDSDYRALADLARTITATAPGLTAGYYFSNSDPYHFQLNESLVDSQIKYQTLRRAGIFRGAAVFLLGAGLATMLGRH